VLEDQKIKAIKLYRQSTGVGLKEAKEFIEEVQRRAGVGLSRTTNRLADRHDLLYGVFRNRIRILLCKFNEVGSQFRPQVSILFRGIDFARSLPQFYLSGRPKGHRIIECRPCDHEITGTRQDLLSSFFHPHDFER
jgi:hypothetical protein